MLGMVVVYAIILNSLPVIFGVERTQTSLIGGINWFGLVICGIWLALRILTYVVSDADEMRNASQCFVLDAVFHLIVLPAWFLFISLDLIPDLRQPLFLPDLLTLIIFMIYSSLFLAILILLIPFYLWFPGNVKHVRSKIFNNLYLAATPATNQQHCV